MGSESDVRRLAEAHVEWLISFIVPIIRRIGVEEFMHGYKHGHDAVKKEINNGNDE